jgi:hypothetical protein
MKRILILSIAVLLTAVTRSQSFAINTDGSTAHSSAILDVKSTTKGLLIPRMSKVQRNTIAAPATGLLVYQNAPDSTGIYYYNGSNWQRMEENGNAWGLNGNAGTSPFTNILGTTDLTDLSIGVHNIPRLFVTTESEVAIGMPDPKYGLDVTTGNAAINNCAQNGIRVKTVGAGSSNICEQGLFMGYPDPASTISNEALIWNYGQASAGVKTLALGVGPGLTMMRLTSNGLAGIGSGSMQPQYALDVNVGIGGVTPCSNRNGLRLNTLQAAGNPCENGLFLGYDYNNAANLNSTSLWNFSADNTGTNRYIRFGFGLDFSESPGIGEALRILPPGKGVGINQTNPLAMLHISNYTGGGVLPGVMITSPSLPTNTNGFYSGLRITGAPNEGYVWNYQNAAIIFGTNDAERMRIKDNGNVGINTTNPLAKLHVADSSVLFSANGVIPSTPGDVPVSGEGRRMLWYANKAAFRVGYVDGVQWDTDSIGVYSFAAGYNTKAKDYSVALGTDTKASNGSLSAGGYTTASGLFAFATGLNATASGETSLSAGTQTRALGNYSLVGGYYTTAFNTYSVALGNRNTVSGSASFAMGNEVHVNGNQSAAFGKYINLAATYSFATGSYNDISDFPDPQNPAANDRIFQIGNGTDVTARSNAITILRNGNTGIGITAPGFPLNFASALGDKISLWGNTGNHYGFGIQSNLLQIHSAGNSDDIAFGYGSSTAFTERMRIKGNGNVGIGNNNPSRPLSFPAALGEKILLYPGGAGEVGMGVYGNEFRLHTDYSLADITFGHSNNSNVFTETMRIKGNGNVGIGTTNPTKQTEIIGAASATPVTLVIGNRGGFGPAAMEFVSDYGLTNQWRPGYIRSNDLGGFTGTLEFYTNGTGTLYGNVKGFEVRNGTALTATGAVGTFSDERLKKNIQAFTDGLNVISKINPVQFRYNEFSPFLTDRQQVGILAQELEKVAPYMVDKTTTKDFTDLRSVNNQAYIFLLINAVKELQKEVEELKKETSKTLHAVPGR